MVSLKAAAPQTLDDYHRGIEQLTTLYPHAWGLIFCADELMRSEMWDKIREELEDEEEWPEKVPWNKVIQMSTYGRGDAERQHWWFTHVVAPATQGGGGKSTVAIFEGSSNLPAEDGLFGGGGRPKSTRRGYRGGNQQKTIQADAKGGNWNKNKGYGGKGAKSYDNYWDMNKGKGKGGKNKSKSGGKDFGKAGKGKSEPTK